MTHLAQPGFALDPVPQAGRPTNLPASSELASTALALFRDVVSGLGKTPKTLPCKYFYDERGSDLFERICETPEYYVTRTELDLLRTASPVVARCVGREADVLEPGSGAGEKIRILLDALKKPRSYTPVEISPTALEASVRSLRTDYPELHIAPMIADFSRGLPSPKHFVQGAGARLIFFPGSTIGNFVPEEAEALLRGMGSLLRAGDWLFIYVDRLKSVATLEAAYDDASGVTAEFNLNLLHRIKRELPTDLRPENFRHEARFNARKSRVEMHLVSRVSHSVRVGRAWFEFFAGESIHTENSHKYSVEAFSSLSERAGYEVERTFSDREGLYSLYLLRQRG